MTAKELEKIYTEAYKAVYWTAMALLKNETDAEDVVQDSFVSFMESYSDLEDTGRAVALLKKIAANKCLNRIKLARTDNVEDEFFETVEAVPEDFLPDSIVESEDTRKIIMDIINNVLSDDVRRTLIKESYKKVRKPLHISSACKRAGTCAHESLLIDCWRDVLSKNGEYINQRGRMS